MSGALDGIRVLEVANFIAGPYAGGILSDLGAEVIKVENLEGGDPFRAWDLGGDSPTFWAYNRGKKSITINLRAPEGADAFRALARDADVVLENLRPGAMDRLGLGYKQLKELNSRLIYCAVSGFGQSGPYVHKPAYDGVGQALSGMVSVLADPDNPRPIGPNFSDSLSATFGAIGILGALVARQKTGKGQRVDTSLVAATLGFLIAPATETLAGKPPPHNLSRPISSQTYAWKGSDGKPFTVHLSSPPKFWEGLCRAAGRPELIDDERFKTRVARRAHYHELHAELKQVFETQPRDYWLQRLEAEDTPSAPMYNMAEVFQDPQIQHMGMEISIPRLDKPPIRTVRFSVEYSDTPLPLPAPPPGYGEQTDELLERAGYGQDAIQELHAKGVIEPAKHPTGGSEG
jgi:crotonobetainyl-CoA:carnitine CoA-transferase CaiB-like acyl-CoA transferase